MAQWYLNYSGEQIGPLDDMQAREHVRQKPNSMAWREGFTTWLPIHQIVELNTSTSSIRPPAINTVSTGIKRADEIDFKIFGTEMQFVEIELDPDESAVAEAGAMMYKDKSVSMSTVFGDGSEASNGSGFMGRLLGAGKRLVTGESLFTTVFTHTGHGKAHVAFGAPYPGNIIPIALENLGGSIICQKDAFLCAARGVSIGIHFQKKILTGLFGGEGFIMQRLDGDGMAFLHAGGSIIERELNTGEELHVDTGCIVAYETQVGFDLQQAGGIKTSLFGGEGLFFARLRGPGKIWLQSLPFSRLAGRMLQAAPQRGGNTGEGSILGSIGNLLDGDN